MYLIQSGLARAESLYGSKPAAVCGELSYTYAELGVRVRKLSGVLDGLGVKQGSTVAVLMQNCHRYLESYYAIPAIGAVLVPLNNRHSLAEQRYICGDAGIEVLIVDEIHREIAEQLRDVVKHILLAPEDYELGLEAAEEHPAIFELDPESLGGLFYTGGTTGASKGVMLSHRNISTNAMHAAVCLGYRDTDVYLHAGPMFHLADGASTFAVTWIGGTHTFVGQFDPGRVLQTIEQLGVTVTMLVPVMINAIVNDPRTEQSDLASLRLILHGGAPIAPELLRTAIKTLRCSFTQAYGMTEAAPLLTALSNEEDLVDSPRIASAGRPIVGVEVRVLREDGTLCEDDEVGEVVARGPNMLQGYWRKPEETKAAMRDGWYWSGDMARRDSDGFIYIVDRSKDMIISGGENVYSTEVEAAIYAHPAILEAAVIGIPDERWGEAVHAVVVLKPGAELTAEQLREHCKGHIAGYKCPRGVDFVDVLPKSGAGKILKRDLKAPYWEANDRGVS